MQNFEERIHLITYALLAITWYHRAPKDSSWAKMTARVMPLCFVVAVIDETIQAILPFRVGDPWDVYYDLAGAFWGVSLRRLLSF